MIGEEDLVMVEQGNKDGKMYAYLIHRIGDMVTSPKYANEVSTMRECYGKMGLYASASDFLRMIEDARLRRDNKEELDECIRTLACEALLIISIYMGTEPSDVVRSQLEMYELKNLRYGNSFAECFAKDGYPYAFGHLQEKANRICSLLTLNEEVGEEPILDSYKDFLGYCVLTLVEINRA